MRLRTFDDVRLSQMLRRVVFVGMHWFQDVRIGM